MPTTEPTTKPTTEPTTKESTTEPSTEESTTEPTTKPTTESTTEPTTEQTTVPTTEPTTAATVEIIESVVSKVKEVKIVKTSDGTSTIVATEKMTAYNLRIAAPAAKIVDASGKEVGDKSPLATGMKIILNKETVEIAILGDVNGDAEISVTDARLALRHSVSLESLTGVYLTAGKIGSDTISVSEARKILRAAVGLDDSKEWLK